MLQAWGTLEKLGKGSSSCRMMMTGGIMKQLLVWTGSGFLKSGRHYKRGPLHPLTGKTRETLPTMEKTMSAKPQKYLAIREQNHNNCNCGDSYNCNYDARGHLLILQEFKGCNFKDSWGAPQLAFRWKSGWENGFSSALNVNMFIQIEYLGCIGDGLQWMGKWTSQTSNCIWFLKMSRKGKHWIPTCIWLGGWVRIAMCVVEHPLVLGF